jgi:hypothetical protein
MATTAELRNLWAPACNLRPSATYTFWTGVRIPVDGRIIPALKALDACLLRWNYRPKAGQTFGYACRRITGGSGYSLHAYGIAIDINSLANPYGHRLITDMPPAMVAAIKSIRTTAGVPVWRWGGDFNGPYDAMHYEIQCSPGQLAAGIAGGITAPTPTPAPPQEDDDVLTPDQAADLKTIKEYAAADQGLQAKTVALLEQVVAKLNELAARP